MEHSFLEEVFKKWASSCQKMIVYQHDADETVNRTHIHCFFSQCKYKTNVSLKNIFHETIETERYGNELWAWREGDYLENGEEKYITYMSKGKLDPVFNKGYDVNVLAELKSKWVPPKKIEDEVVSKHLTKFEIAHSVVNYLQKRDVEDPTMATDEFIMNRIVKELRDNKQAMGIYKTIDIYDTVIMFYNKNKFIKDACNIIEKRRKY